MQAGTCADDLGIDVVGIQLLHREQTEDRQGAVREASGHGGNRKGRDHAKKRPEIRNNIEETAQNPNNDRVIDPKHGQNHLGQESDDETVDQCAFDEG